MTQIIENNYTFRTKWIDEESLFCVSLVCNGEELEHHKFEGHQQMMEWISDTMAGLQLCGEDWTFAESNNNQSIGFSAERTLNNLREMKQGVLEEIHQQISDGVEYELSSPYIIHWIDGDDTAKMNCIRVGNDTNGNLYFVTQSEDLHDEFTDMAETLLRYDTESLLAVLEAVKEEVKKVVERRPLVEQFALFIHRFGKEHPDYEDLVIEATCGQSIARLIIDQRDCDLYRILNHDGEYIEFDFCDAAGNDVVKNIRDLSLEQIGKITKALDLRYMVEFFK